MKPAKTYRPQKLRLWLALRRQYGAELHANFAAARRYILSNPATVYTSPLEVLAAFTF